MPGISTHKNFDFEEFVGLNVAYPDPAMVVVVEYEKYRFNPARL